MKTHHWWQLWHIFESYKCQKLPLLCPTRKQPVSCRSCVECGMYRQILLQVTGTVNVLANFWTRLTTLLDNESFTFLVLVYKSSYGLVSSNCLFYRISFFEIAAAGTFLSFLPRVLQLLSEWKQCVVNYSRNCTCRSQYSDLHVAIRIALVMADNWGRSNTVWWWAHHELGWSTQCEVDVYEGGNTT